MNFFYRVVYCAQRQALVSCTSRAGPTNHKVNFQRHLRKSSCVSVGEAPAAALIGKFTADLGFLENNVSYSNYQ